MVRGRQRSISTEISASGAMTAVKRWEPTFVLAAGVGLAAFAWVHLTVVDPYARVNLAHLSAGARTAIETSRFTRLWQDAAYGAQVALAAGIIGAVGPTAWRTRRTDWLALGGLAGISWLLVGGWVQRLLLNLFRFRLGGTSWNGIITNVIFLVAGGVVCLVLGRAIGRRGRPVAEVEESSRDAAEVSV